MMTSVVRAFFHAGFLKAGTPFEIASTPVTAAPPEAKACITTNSVAPSRIPLPCWPKWTTPAALCDACGSPPFISWKSPQPRSTTMLTMKKYVGTAKTRPDSRTPRRLPNAMRMTNETEIGTTYGVSIGKADATAAVPAATDTDTVST